MRLHRKITEQFFFRDFTSLLFWTFPSLLSIINDSFSLKKDFFFLLEVENFIHHFNSSNIFFPEITDVSDFHFDIEYKATENVLKRENSNYTYVTKCTEILLFVGSIHFLFTAKETSRQFFNMKFSWNEFVVENIEVIYLLLKKY